MIARYSRPEMSETMSPDARFKFMLEVEKAVAEVQGKLGIIPQAAALDIQNLKSVDVERILEIEKTTKHDVIAFVSSLAEKAGDSGKFIHFGLTSSDVLDTALSCQIKEAAKILLPTLESLISALKKRVEQDAEVVCVGRTHGMYAEPLSLGYKWAGFHQEFLRHQRRLQTAFEQLLICKLSGAVGAYSVLTPQFEKAVANVLGLKSEVIATQVIPRDRLAELFTSFALIAGGIERLCVELRHLQRSEIGEVEEFFSSGQKGSSAMPHKKNPISAENLTGCARLLRSYVTPALENVALWHERDISHSSVERVILPDSLILLDYALNRLTILMKDLVIQREEIQGTIDHTQGKIFSSHLLLKLIEMGMSREDAYKEVQNLSLQIPLGSNLKNQCEQSPTVKKLVDQSYLDDLFSGKVHLKNALSHLKSLGYQIGDGK